MTLALRLIVVCCASVFFLGVPHLIDRFDQLIKRIDTDMDINMDVQPLHCMVDSLWKRKVFNLN